MVIEIKNCESLERIAVALEGLLEQDKICTEINKVTIAQAQAMLQQQEKLIDHVGAY